MSQLHQMQLSYVAEEDRILLRMNTRSRQEFRFWVTRRYVDLLWKTITRVLEKRAEQESPEVHDELKKAAQIEEKHKKTVENSDFQTQYQESSYLPLGEEPALLFSAGIKSDPEGRALLCMHPKNGQGIELALNDQIVHSFCKLLADTSEKASWGLELSWAKIAPSPDFGKNDQGLN